MTAAIDAVREAFVDLSTGKADVPLRTPVPLAGDGAEPSAEGHSFVPAVLVGQGLRSAGIEAAGPHASAGLD